MCFETALRVTSMRDAVSKDSLFIKDLADKPCLSFLNDQDELESITWKEFANKVETLAAHLQSLPEGRIVLLLKRSCSMQVSQAACLLAGRTFVPIDPAWPQERISHLISVTEAVAVLVDKGSALLEDLSVHSIEMNLLGNVTSCKSLMGATYTPTNEPEIMYIMFTSGSTGEPKGVEVTTKGVYTHLVWKAEALKVTSTDSFLMKTPATFDVSIGEMWLPLVTGTVSHVLGDGLHLEADKTYHALKKAKVTICHFVPSILTLFLSDLEGQHLDLPHLRMIQCTGEALKQEHRTQLSRVLGNRIELVNLYGPTEASIEVTYMYCEEKEEQYLSHGFPIGYAPKGVDIFITDVDDPTRQVEDGNKGEICIGGIQVAKGYLKQVDKTKERFLPCPWPTSSGVQVMYRTGDLGRRNPETGWLEYNGRFDRQVKIGGVRIELGEIESVVMRLFADALDTAAVLCLNNQLIGVLVPKEDSDIDMPTMKEISDGILSALPKAYNPHEWHTIPKAEIPLSTAGKIDFNALEKLVTNQLSVQVWAEVYDQLYDDNRVTAEEGADPTMDWASYKDSFNPTELHRRDVVSEWVKETVEIALHHAKESAGSEQAASICEMGCGKGMIVLKMAPRVKAAVCGDISKFAVKHVQKVWDGYMKENKIHGCNKLFHVVNCDAAAFEKLPKSIQRYNVVLCNGVSMYLPSFTYVLTYFDGAVDRIDLRKGGAVILGDVRSWHHSPLFQLRRLMQIGRSADKARAQAADYSRDDKDRVYDFRAFHALHHLGFMHERVEAVEVQLKQGTLASEFTGYRFDVIYHVRPETAEEEKKGSGDSATDENILPVQIAGQGISRVCDVVSALKNAVAEADCDADSTVFGVVGIPNQRLWSDHLVASSQNDDIGFATEGVGVKPSELRSALRDAFRSNKHIVLTWNRQIGDLTNLADAELAAMDVFVVPAQHSNAKMAGLRGISQFALDPHPNFCAKLKKRSDFESCISELQSSKSSSAGTQKQDFQTAAKNAKTALDMGHVTLAVETMVACSLGHAHQAFLDIMQQAEKDVTFEELGGNSFMAMKLILQLRSSLGAAPAVFKLLTEPLTEFLQDATHVIERQRENTKEAAAAGEWMVQVDLPGPNGTVAANAPIIILFPTAGGSPKVYAKTFSQLKTMLGSSKNPQGIVSTTTGAKVLMGQPPGRDARADEPNCRNFDDLIASYTQAIVDVLHLDDTNGKNILGNNNNNKIIMCGDSLGSIVCWSVAQALRQRYGQTVFHLIHHMVLSGNPCPAVASHQFGLGTFAKQSIHQETDQDLLDFLAKGHSGFTTSDSNSNSKEVLEALRSDCILYEDFQRPDDAMPLSCPATFCRGSEDPFVTEEDVKSWKNEFTHSKSTNYVVLNDAGHHIYSEAGSEMAKLLVDIIIDGKEEY